MTELLALKQTGSFTDYHDKFELLLGRVTLTEAYAISHFINGLRPPVQRAVRLFMPQTLVHAYALCAPAGFVYSDKGWVLSPS